MIALSQRQTEVLKMLANGLRTKQIADRLGISYGTTRTHMQAISRRLKARSLPHAVAIGIRAGVVD